MLHVIYVLAMSKSCEIGLRALQRINAVQCCTPAKIAEATAGLRALETSLRPATRELQRLRKLSQGWIVILTAVLAHLSTTTHQLKACS
jgi:hypothetical protein